MNENIKSYKKKTQWLSFTRKTNLECRQPARIRKASSTPIVITKKGTTVRILENGIPIAQSIPTDVIIAIAGDNIPMMA